MRAMILAAGFGERMRPLTDKCPKPLLEVGGHALIEYHLYALKKAGIANIVINHAHLGGMIERHLGDGSKYGLSIVYSREGSPLETAGGIANALPLLGDAPFLVINGDIWCDYPLRSIPQQIEGLAHLILVDNPKHNLKGDFSLTDGYVSSESEHEDERLTFAGIGLYQPKLFEGISRGARAALAPLLISAMEEKRVTGEHYHGQWYDIGTPQRLSELDRKLNDQIS
ncbi:MAG: nucleotidyltransferase family protein [Gammaproteobacteria bacterium]|nr:nucleotidyltransferase family protein [Gammaproteobacteria bacterium]